MNKYVSIGVAGAVAAVGAVVGYEEAYILDCTRVCPAMLHKGSVGEAALGGVRYAAVKVPGRCTEAGDFLAPGEWLEKQRLDGVEFLPWNECYEDPDVPGIGLTLGGMGAALGGVGAVRESLAVAVAETPLEAAPNLGRCACWGPDLGTCSVTNEGATAPLPYPDVAQPGTFDGPGCVRRTCVEMAGVSAAPAECFNPAKCACRPTVAGQRPCKLLDAGTPDIGVELDEGTFRPAPFGGCIPMVCTKYGGSLPQECVP